MIGAAEPPPRPLTPPRQPQSTSPPPTHPHSAAGSWLLAKGPSLGGLRLPSARCFLPLSKGAQCGPTAGAGGSGRFAQGEGFLAAPRPGLRPGSLRRSAPWWREDGLRAATVTATNHGPLGKSGRAARRARLLGSAVQFSLRSDRARRHLREPWCPRGPVPGSRGALGLVRDREQRSVGRGEREPRNRAAARGHGQACAFRGEGTIP